MSGQSARALSLARVVSTNLFVRGHRVILDRDLAALYGVTTGNLNKVVDRNLGRFPPDFMIRLTATDLRNLIFQSGRSSWGGTRRSPRAFTEQGVAMLSGVLHSPRAVQVNIEIMRAFVRLRQLLVANSDLARKLATLERKYDSQFRVVFEAIRELMAPPLKPTKRIGFRRDPSRWLWGVDAEGVFRLPFEADAAGPRRRSGVAMKTASLLIAILLAGGFCACGPSGMVDQGTTSAASGSGGSSSSATTSQATGSNGSSGGTSTATSFRLAVFIGLRQQELDGLRI